MTNKEKINEILKCENCKKQLSIGGLNCPPTCAEFNNLMQMAQWKDQHPRKGLWDSKKVIEWLALNCELYGGFNYGKLNQMCENLIKSMEE